MKKGFSFAMRKHLLTVLSILGTALLVPAEGGMMGIQLWLVLPLFLVLCLVGLIMLLVPKWGAEKKV